MKAIKLILVILTVVLTVSVNAQDAWFDDVPTLNMGSTSGMSVSGSDLPSAALGGVSMAAMPEASMGETPLISKGPRRAGMDDDGWDDEDFSDHGEEPFVDPIGPMPWMLMLLLCGGYAAAAAYRRREEM